MFSYHFDRIRIWERKGRGELDEGKDRFDCPSVNFRFRQFCEFLSFSRQNSIYVKLVTDFNILTFCLVPLLTILLLFLIHILVLNFVCSLLFTSVLVLVLAIVLFLDLFFVPVIFVHLALFTASSSTVSSFSTSSYHCCFHQSTSSSSVLLIILVVGFLSVQLALWLWRVLECGFAYSCYSTFLTSIILL